jgi:hypothetical protein
MTCSAFFGSDFFCAGALLRALLAIQDIGARDLVLAAAHERELHLVLDLLDVDRAAFGLALHQRAHDGVGQARHLVADARAGGTLAAVDGQERLGHGDGDLGRLEADHGAVAADDLVLGVARIGAGAHRTAGLTHDQVPRWLLGRGGGGGRGLHGECSSGILSVVLHSQPFRGFARVWGKAKKGPACRARALRP